MNYFRLLSVILITTVCNIGICSISFAQSDQSVGNWNILVLKGKIAPKWSILCEDHIRNTNYNLKYDYFEVKAGIYYLLTKNLSVAVGSGYYDKFTTGGFFQRPELQKEIRTWGELYFKQAYSRFYFDHRLRIEQRFLPEIYKNRLKYKSGLTVPINKSQLVGGCIYLEVNDELFMPQHGPFVERNYFFAGAGYLLAGNMSLKMGCLSDFDYQPGNHTVKNYLQLILIYDFTNLVRKWA